VLLARAAGTTAIGGRWFLPGGGLEFGEDPPGALVREFEEETGLDVEVGRLLGVLSDTATLPDGSGLHTVRLVYAITSWAGTLRHETDGSTDEARWVARAEVGSLPVLPYVRTALEVLAP